GTIHRRNQKLIEETPSPAVDDALRERIGDIAVTAARAVGYRSAGTLEGLLTRDGEWFFLEMNTRIQVEHTVTELVTGLDLVREQVLIAAGEPLSLRQEDVRLSGHAIECRINAEDVANGFLPTPGRITGYREPAGPVVRGGTRGLEVDGGRFSVTVLEPEPPWLELARRRRHRSAGGAGGAGREAVASPMQGTVLSVSVAEGDEVQAGELLCIVEAMKMENEIHAHRAGTVSQLSVAPGQPVSMGQVI